MYGPSSRTSNELPSDFHREVTLIEETVKMQIAGVYGLTNSLAKKVLKTETRNASLLVRNKKLQEKVNTLEFQVEQLRAEVMALKTVKGNLSGRANSSAMKTTG